MMSTAQKIYQKLTHVIASRGIKIFFSMAIATAVLYFFLREVSGVDILARLKMVKLSYIFTAFFIYIAMNAIKAYRFYIFLDRPIAYPSLLNFVFLHNFFNATLPFRLGELSYIYFIKKNTDVGMAKNIVSLVGARVFDLLALMIIIIFATLSLYSTVDYSHNIIMAALFILISTFMVFIALVFFTKLSQRFFSKWPALQHKFQEMSDSLAGILKKDLFFKFLFSSLLIWMATFLMGWVLFRGVGIKLILPAAVIAYAFPIIISATPAQLFGGFGSYEGSLIAGFLIFGLAKSVAVTASLILHLSELIFVSLLAAWGFIWYQLIFKRRAS